ncbi:AraD1 family protein [Chelativorans sp. J32]|uniref:AraD1 family protein n=1 Tax=Chelativorans sp. J32 TaxID=935840 RepID=UPI000489263A|nr:AraD1 family protein [Chelativorans sp. J32]
MRLIQFESRDAGRAVGVVEDSGVRRLSRFRTVRDLALAAIEAGQSIVELVSAHVTEEVLDYEALLSEGRVLPPMDHPDPAHCIIAGTGLTHIGSAASRGSMHEEGAPKPSIDMNDSMRMFAWGLKGGKPAGGVVGVQPEWFYKGDGSTAVRPGGVIPIPGFAEDTGDEPEVVALYVVGNDGQPYRVGFAIGNEVTDHKMEKKNYLYLAHAKLRNCSFGPELLVGDLPREVNGRVTIRRDGKVLWTKEFATGEENMSHSLDNLEYHHFKYGQFRRPGDVHVFFLGTSVASFADGVETRNGDVFEVDIPVLGRPLTNEIRETADTFTIGQVRAL